MPLETSKDSSLLTPQPATPVDGAAAEFDAFLLRLRHEISDNDFLMGYEKYSEGGVYARDFCISFMDEFRAGPQEAAQNYLLKPSGDSWIVDGDYVPGALVYLLAAVAVMI